jgi:hypothetical protein
VPKAGADTFWREEEQTQPKIGEEWQKGLSQLDDIEPRNWILTGAQIGRRIPKEFRAPYRNILVNICNEQDKQARLGNPTEMRRIEKLLIMVQAMLHRIPKGETTSTNPPKQLPLELNSFIANILPLRKEDSKSCSKKKTCWKRGTPRKKERSIMPNNKSWAERHARSNSGTQPNWQMRPSHT